MAKRLPLGEMREIAEGKRKPRTAHARDFLQPRTLRLLCERRTPHSLRACARTKVIFASVLKGPALCSDHARLRGT
jgi:hypothetical protein